MMKFLAVMCVLDAIFVVSECVVSSWGEMCNHTAECADHRLVCSPDEFNVSKCACDRFHEWNGTTVGCAQKYDIDTILNMTLVSTDNKGALEKDQEKIFMGHKVAGLFVMSVALLCPIVIIVHCCHMKRKDRHLINEVVEVKKRVEQTKRHKGGYRLASSGIV